MKPRIDILQGDCLAALEYIPDESVHCVITSPPYWGLRDYGVSGQIGLEQSLGEHLDMMVKVFREVRRVLRKDGTLWLNYGDAYASAPNGRSAADVKAIGNDDRTFRDKPMSTVGPVYRVGSPGHQSGRAGRSGNLRDFGGAGTNGVGIPDGRVVAGGYMKPKDRMLLPARVAIALQEDGWWVRDEIVWHKPNPMPISVRDRTTPAHEMLYLLSKSNRYYYDQEAIKEPIADASKKRYAQETLNTQTGGFKQDAYESGIVGQRSRSRRPAEIIKTLAGSTHRNRRSVWTVPTKPFTESHFATFPPDLIEPCILAGSPEQCCSKCGAPVVRLTEKAFIPQQDVSSEKGIRGAGTQKPLDKSSGWQGSARGTTRVETTGWQASCRCGAPMTGGTVLDPFFGAGTTGLVAQRNGRNTIGIELNSDYVQIAKRRLGLIADVFA